MQILKPDPKSKLSICRYRHIPGGAHGGPPAGPAVIGRDGEYLHAPYYQLEDERAAYIFRATLRCTGNGGWGAFKYVTFVDDVEGIEFKMPVNGLAELLMALPEGRIQIVNGCFVGEFKFGSHNRRLYIRPHLE